MTVDPGRIGVALETGSKRTFASALDWPGWVRSGRDEAGALEALLAYAPRYERTLRSSGVPFQPPSDVASFAVFERLDGNATTDFGAPDIAATAESGPIDANELERLQSLLAACWRFLGEVVQDAGDRPLRKGPRGGGRDVDRIVEHVTEAHQNYRRRILWPEKPAKVDDLAAALTALIDADSRALREAASGEMPETGPRGGTLWKPRYFVRRATWHILDHAWEIEDRLEP